MTRSTAGAAPVAIIMGSQSDWTTMKHAAQTLDALEVRHDARIVSAHRTPDRLVAFAKNAKAEGFRVVIAGAGGAAHLPGMIAAMTRLPVLGVPVESAALKGMDSLLSIVQMPARGDQRGAAGGGRAGAERRRARRAARRMAAGADGIDRRPARGRGLTPWRSLS